MCDDRPRGKYEPVLLPLKFYPILLGGLSSHIVILSGSEGSVPGPQNINFLTSIFSFTPHSPINTINTTIRDPSLTVKANTYGPSHQSTH